MRSSGNAISGRCQKKSLWQQLKDERAFKFSLLMFVLALVYAACILVGSYLVDPDNSISSVPLLVLAFVGLTVLFYLICLALRAFINHSQLKSESRNSISVDSKINRRLFIIAAIVLIIAWLPWLISSYPGMVHQDTVITFAQWTGLLTPCDHDPWFDTVIFGTFYDFGANVLGSATRGIFLYCTLQMCLLAFVTSFSISYCSKCGMPRGLVIGILVVACVLPIYPISAAFMAKDMLFTIFFIPMLICYVEVVRTKGRFLTKISHVVLFTLLLVFAVLAKKTCLYIDIILFVALTIYIKGSMKKFLIAPFAIMLICSLAWSSVLLPAIGVQQGQKKEAMAIPLQQLARTVAENPASLSNDDIQAIEYFFGENNIGDLYQPTYVDHVKDALSEDALSSDTKYFIWLWLDVGSKSPSTYLSAIAHHDVALFYPMDSLYSDFEINNSFVSNEHFLTNYVNLAKVHGSTWPEGFSDSDFASFVTQFTMSGFGSFGLRVSMMTAINSIPILSFLASSAFVPSWLLFFVFLCSMSLSGMDKHKRVMVLMLALPWIIYLLTLMVGPTILMRYMAPLYFAAPLLCVIPFIAARGVVAEDPIAKESNTSNRDDLPVTTSDQLSSPGRHIKSSLNAR